MGESLDKLPVHVAVIMDGNGRWARRRHRSRNEGHLEGAESVRSIVRSCTEIDIQFLTLYAFSTENWNRPGAEVRFLMRQLGKFLSGEREEMVEKGIRFRAIGRRAQLPANVVREIGRTEQATAGGGTLQLNLALNYGARAELTDACRELCEEAAGGRLKPGDVDERALEQRLYTAGMPDPDLLIRTGGEMRLSNFLLWQLSYSEIYITETLWPDFRDDAFQAALREYARRERRFGRVEG